ncbi:MAG: PadR family transcriptional regulator [Gemmatimonadales bacterium]
MPASLPLRSVEFEVLITLAQGDRHGYAVIQETAARTGGRVRLETGTLYRALKRLVEAGLVRPAGRRTDAPADQRRRYYAITAAGRRAAATEAARLSRLVESARSAHLLPGTAGS